ncbi:hypothetical protein Q3Y53_08990 [Synechococcus sp. YX-04-1]|nr:hypothetical protein [Synechococcus sp. YX-04-1]
MTVHQFLDLIAKASIITVNVGGPLKDIAYKARQPADPQDQKARFLTA